MNNESYKKTLEETGKSGLLGPVYTMKQVLPPPDNREKVINETASEAAGIGTGLLAGGLIFHSLAKYSDKFKNFAFKDGIVNLKEGLRFRGAAAGVAIIGGLALVGSAIMNGMAKRANQKYRDTKSQLDQATHIIANQESEIAGLRGEAPGTRERFASMGAAHTGGYIDRLAEERAQAALAERGV